MRLCSHPASDTTGRGASKPLRIQRFAAEYMISVNPSNTPGASALLQGANWTRVLHRCAGQLQTLAAGD